MVKFGGILLFADLIIGLYLVNLGIKFVVLPVPETLNNWIILLGGALLIFSGLMSMISSKRIERFRRK
ncbi:hypothetical protein M0R19_00400 [Candidatus Pacearchaeota archaeon]|jgi:hypothetical protein|nr:hypothetical protein [Candidatus Pacearchaeota archaeon]